MCNSNYICFLKDFLQFSRFSSGKGCTQITQVNGVVDNSLVLMQHLLKTLPGR